ncbi:lycopene cyclase domain-containing protein [Mycobacterium kansasii]|uniref:Lycopene cyclase n=3 Tax=Mycobacterium kansasii TaxID=1768 RepID=A0A1V3X5G5_MYCKA|nr:lycopene cyclase domain-containing protein [Mycobacterium kansasii]ETZ98785.1 lycopene cyclase domain protein [Mycobacterium kansasii 824]AGZ50663.1 lycopene cyclase [Mycobacterium kansasii ATCC 12478]ARG63054.1 lycopene cyclase [Mycobacterium kansasii]ARG70689.1 lycopene cyclase [Mycobacterium kansasii]ARG74757.1 lycopene cyclase [Mycobacterium kansasii]
MNDHWQYLLVLAACLAITAPLEFFGNGVYRQPLRLLRAVLPVAAVFLIWDEVAVAAGIWTYDARYISGVAVPFRVPVEEVLFFVVIPICALLTYNAVSTILDRLTRR